MVLFNDVCPHFGICGGCSIQDSAYANQLEKKSERVETALKEVLEESANVNPILPSPEIFYYRNKMEFSFGDSRDVGILSVPKGKKGETKRERRALKNERKEKEKVAADIAPAERRVHLGLHPRKRFNLVTPTPECRLLSEPSLEILQEVANWATENHVPIYTRHDGEGILRHLVIREGKNTGERLVALFAKSSLVGEDELADRLKKFPITTFVRVTHDGLSDVAQGTEAKVFWGDGFIQEEVLGRRFRVPLSSFMQTNTRASEKMISLLKTWALSDSGGKGFPLLFDLFCGVGTIGLSLSDGARRLVGIEINPAAIDEAKINAQINGVQNAEFTAGKVEEQVDLFEKKPGAKEALLIVDPPRAGIHKAALEAILRTETPFIYYVSCNPDSLARDLRALGAKYRMEIVQPMDFFPHTDHVETAVKLSLRKK